MRSNHTTHGHRHHRPAARPAHGARWNIPGGLSVRFVHNTVDGANHLRAVALDTKQTVLKLKNRPGSRRCPSVPVLNLLLTVVSSTDPRLASLTDRSVTLTEQGDGRYALVLRGRLDGSWQNVPDDTVDETGLTQYTISGHDRHEATTAADRMMDRVALLATGELAAVTDAVAQLRHALGAH